MPSVKDYHAEALAQELTWEDSRVKAILEENMRKVQTAASGKSRNMTGAKYTAWSCSMGQNYGGKRS